VLRWISLGFLVTIALLLLWIASHTQAREKQKQTTEVAAMVAKGAVTEWGPRVNLKGLKDLYAPQTIKPFTATPGGIDNLALSSTDSFLIPGKGEMKVDFKGYFRVARENPTTNDWATADVFVNMIDLFLRGEAPGIGTISVGLNPQFVSAGQVLAGGGPTQGSECRIAVAAQFEMPGMSVLLNKEPILLMNNSIKSLPPVEDPNGAAQIYNLPLYDSKNPNGRPVAYLRSLKYTVGNYITETEAKAFREAEEKAFGKR